MFVIPSYKNYLARTGPEKERKPESTGEKERERTSRREIDRGSERKKETVRQTTSDPVLRCCSL